MFRDLLLGMARSVYELLTPSAHRRLHAAEADTEIVMFGRGSSPARGLPVLAAE